MLQRGREAWKKSNEVTLCTEHCCSSCSSTRSSQSSFWLAEFPMQGSPPGTGKQDKHTHFVDLWGFKPDMALGNTKQGIFFFVCVCARLNSMVRQACPYRSWALKMCLCHDRNPLISSAVNIKQIWEGNRTMLWLARLNLSYIMRQWCRTVPTPDPSKSQVQEPSGWYRGSHSWTWSLRRALEFSWNPA